MDNKDLELISSSWWKILKALAFDGGPSSTRWVYLLSATVVAFSIVLMSIAFCWVYVTKDHQASAIVAGAIAGTITALFGFASRAQNIKNKIADEPDQQQ